MFIEAFIQRMRVVNLPKSETCFPKNDNSGSGMFEHETEQQLKSHVPQPRNAQGVLQALEGSGG